MTDYPDRPTTTDSVPLASEAAIFTERVGLLYRNMPFAQIMLLALALLVTLVVSGQSGSAGLGYWLAAMAVIGMLRWLLALRFLRAGNGAADTSRAYRRALAGTVAAGLGWGALTVFYFQSIPLEYQYFIILVLAGVVAGAVPVLSADLGSFLVYEGLTLTPLVWVLLAAERPIFFLFAVATVLFALTLARSASYLNQQIVENLRERMAKEMALAESRAANARLNAEIEGRKRIEHDLMLARDAAEAASRAKSEFLSTASHELRTPMNGVIGMTQLALDTDLTSEQREYLNTVLQSAEEMLARLTEIIDYASLDSGKMVLRRQAVAPAELAQQAVAEARRAAEARTLALRLILADNLPALVSADAKAVKQVFDQLVDNAIKFTAHGQVDVELAPEAGRRLRFSVRDTGIGIPAAKLNHIFEAFTQADGSLTRRHGGLGLGLALAQRIAVLLGGEIRVESQEGLGSTFHFVFPYEV